MLWGAEKLVSAEYWCPYGTTYDLSKTWLEMDELNGQDEKLKPPLESEQLLEENHTVRYSVWIVHL